MITIMNELLGSAANINTSTTFYHPDMGASGYIDYTIVHGLNKTPDYVGVYVKDYLVVGQNVLVGEYKYRQSGDPTQWYNGYYWWVSPSDPLNTIVIRICNPFVGAGNMFVKTLNFGN